jgi:hypothetical protein
MICSATLGDIIAINLRVSCLSIPKDQRRHDTNEEGGSA